MIKTKQDIIEKIRTTSETLEKNEIAVLDNGKEIIDQKYLGLYFEKQYDQNGDVWNLVKASKYFRRAKIPEKALSMLSRCDTSSNDLTTKSALLAALHTTKGAALADLNELEDAFVEAQTALRHNPYSPYPYNLMGRIAYQSGNPQEGDEYFEKAEEMMQKMTEKEDTGKDKDTEKAIYLAYKTALPQMKEKILNYLKTRNRMLYSRIISS